jgi:hypothetical protein
MTDGKVMMSDGTSVMMKEGEAMLMSGSTVSADVMMGMGTSAKTTMMDDKMMDKDAAPASSTMMEDNQ